LINDVYKFFAPQGIILVGHGHEHTPDTSLTKVEIFPTDGKASGRWPPTQIARAPTKSVNTLFHLLTPHESSHVYPKSDYALEGIKDYGNREVKL
jgi:hypothetical protein